MAQRLLQDIRHEKHQQYFLRMLIHLKCRPRKIELIDDAKVRFWSFEIREFVKPQLIERFFLFKAAFKNKGLIAFFLRIKMQNTATLGVCLFI